MKMALRKKVKASYEQFIKENQTSKYHNIVKEYNEMIKKNGFVVPKNHVAFVEKNGFKTLLGIQPPTY